MIYKSVSHLSFLLIGLFRQWIDFFHEENTYFFPSIYFLIKNHEILKK